MMIIIGVIIWLFVSQMIAWLLVPVNEQHREDAVVTMWAGVFILGPLVPAYALVYLMMKAINWQRSLGSDSSVSADEVIP
jgi:hypothetical protein